MTAFLLRPILGLYILFGSMVASAATPTIPDIEVIDQDGKPHRLYTDLIKGNTVAVTFVYTSCKTSCPAMTGLFGAVQHKLQGESRRPVTLLSISIDPITDRPAQLQAVAKQFGAAPGWYFLTGSSPDVTRLLSAMDIGRSGLADHPSVILIGNDRTGQWTRHYGLASVPMVMELIDSVGESVVHQ
ncbi:MAG: SCO family protein [Nitrospira sp.]